MRFENTEVWGFEGALRGMRNPMASWSKSDSYPSELCIDNEFRIGENDLDLAQRLIKGGTEHRKFLRMIHVQVDITAPLYFWKEFDTYKVSTVANSTSTMHKLANTPITLECFETDDYTMESAGLIQDMGFVEYMDGCEAFDLPSAIIDFLENLRQKYLETKDKRYWKELIRFLPESWLQTRTIDINYETLRNIVHQRKNHKLNEWSGKDNSALPNVISWIHSLPYADELIFYGEE